MLQTENFINDENTNIMQEIDNGIFRVDNQKKKCKRVKLITICILISILIWSELIINFNCIKKIGQYSLLSLDIACYVGLIIIVLVEIIILCLKLKKQRRNEYRIRSRCGNVPLYIYMTSIGIIIVLLIDHTCWQLYFAVSNFEEECFYFEDQIPDRKQFYIIKTIILIVFFAIECFTCYFLVQVFKKSLLTLRKPKRRSNHVFRSESNDIVIIAALNNQSLN